MERFHLVIWDNDGVLVDSEPIANRILAELLTESGWPTTYEDSLREYMGGSMKLVREVVEPKLGRPLPADLEDRYHEQLFLRMRTELLAVEGVREALDELDLPVCVASSGAHARIELALKKTGLYEKFAGHIFSADDVERGKPNPDLFLHAAREMGVAPEHCVVVEDSPLGVTAARAAGMKVIGYAGMTPAERLKDADVVITAMSQLTQQIRRLDAS
ncbi:HAD family hydrolase [Tenggerimyces flavus]|uniref:HAD family hydrolase n=1 Tax=Tenggerimyces flavus TaxID=1708749 RepID=A0ABV7YLR3_9ACTN|nr:HAD family hydrolase [Tenggerimyces flavus]MBM7787489.1 HAD superfamily hydrolase (TIGR01509 family) [Tenggerimyces flavus]